MCCAEFPGRSTGCEAACCERATKELTAEGAAHPITWIKNFNGVDQKQGTNHKPPKWYVHVGPIEEETICWGAKGSHLSTVS